jgi:hypothetical protein
MPIYEVTLTVEVEADSANAAFSEVRSHYAVVNDPQNKVTENLVDFLVEDAVDVTEDVEELATA